MSVNNIMPRRGDVQSCLRYPNQRHAHLQNFFKKQVHCTQQRPSSELSVVPDGDLVHPLIIVIAGTVHLRDPTRPIVMVGSVRLRDGTRPNFITGFGHERDGIRSVGSSLAKRSAALPELVPFLRRLLTRVPSNHRMIPDTARLSRPIHMIRLLIPPLLSLLHIPPGRTAATKPHLH
jgi:hypothetical protein